MPTFNILLAYDTSYYGTTHVDAETWEEAVSSLTSDDWDNECTDTSSDMWEQRVVHVENEEGDILAEDLAMCAYMTGIDSVQHVVGGILADYRTNKDPAAMVKALELFVEELGDSKQHPLLRKDAGQ